MWLNLKSQANGLHVTILRLKNTNDCDCSGSNNNAIYQVLEEKSMNFKSILISDAKNWSYILKGCKVVRRIKENENTYWSKYLADGQDVFSRKNILTLCCFVKIFDLSHLYSLSSNIRAIPLCVPCWHQHTRK